MSIYCEREQWQIFKMSKYCTRYFVANYKLQAVPRNNYSTFPTKPDAGSTNFRIGKAKVQQNSNDICIKSLQNKRDTFFSANDFFGKNFQSNLAFRQKSLAAFFWGPASFIKTNLTAETQN